MKITLGPIPFYWPKSAVKAFYQQARHWPVDRICLGETVCPKRRQLSTEDWLSIADDLTSAGKDVAISTLALVEAESELHALQRLCRESNYLIEVNDLAAVETLAGLGRAFIAGPLLNIYNVQTLSVLVQDGLTDWVMPVELGREQLQHLLATIAAENLPVNTELLVHGYLPLALSARCFTARALDRPKDACKQACLDFPDGITVRSQEDQQLFRLNGIQTLSGEPQDLLAEMDDIHNLPLSAIRISPSRFEMAPVVEAYAEALAGNVVELNQPWRATSCNGYWYGTAGIDRS